MFSSSFSVVLDHCLLLKEPAHLLSLPSSSDPDFFKNLSPVIDTRVFEAAVRVRADWCWASCGLDEESSCVERVPDTTYVLTWHSSHPQDGFPIRIKAVHIVNEPRIFKGIFAIIKPFLKEKIANRVSDFL